MRITIDIDGNEVAACKAQVASEAASELSSDVASIPPELRKAAERIGAISAGPAPGMGASNPTKARVRELAEHAVESAGEAPDAHR